jgi:uncharacterized membrane protein
MNALLALAASALWGTSDFGGGLISRKLHPSAAVLISQALALAGLLVLLPFFRVPAGGYMLTAAAAGIVATLSLAAFYRAMADAPMSLVAPITAAGTVIPVLAGFVRGERLGAVQLAGIGVTLAGIVLASGPEFRSGVRIRRQALLFAIGAAAGFGVAYTLLALAAGSGVYGTLLLQRIGGLIVPRRAGPDWRLRHHRQRQLCPRRQPRRPVGGGRPRVAVSRGHRAARAGNPGRTPPGGTGHRRDSCAGRRSAAELISPAPSSRRIGSHFRPPTLLQEAPSASGPERPRHAVVTRRNACRG